MFCDKDFFSIEDWTERVKLECVCDWWVSSVTVWVELSGVTDIVEDCRGF